MGCQIEILFPLADITDTPQQAVFVDGLANQSWCDLNGSGGTFAPGARPHQIGTDILLPSAPVVPPPVPTVPVPPECLALFDWGSTAVGIGDFAYQGQSNQTDKFGNFIVQSGFKTKIFDPTGNVISNMNTGNLADAVDAWFGGAVVNRGTGFSAGASFAATPLLQGNYILAIFAAAYPVSFSHWAVILEPSATGDPTVLGAVYYEAFLGPPYLAYLHVIGLANSQTINDPILIRGANGLGGLNWVINLLPSISEIISGVYKFGFPVSGMLNCQVPITLYTPIGNVALGQNLVVETLPGANGNLKSGFTLPGSGGGTNVYFYFSRSYMDFCIAGGNRDSEVHNVLQPAYPLGCMIKISMGTLNFPAAATLAHSSGNIAGATGMYVVDNANWNDGAMSLIPFDDEYHYLSSGAVGGHDTFTMQPGAVINRGDGTWWIIFYMPGCDDAQNNTAGTLWEKIRIFEYTPAAEGAIQIMQHTCINYTFNDIAKPPGSIGDVTQALTVIENAGVATVRINGYRNDPGTGRVYQTEFFRFSP